MAIQEDGVALLGFGTSSDGSENIAGYIVSEISEPTEGEVVEVADEHNHFVTSICNHGVATSVTLQVIPKSGTTAPGIGDTMSYDSQTNGAASLFIVHSIDPTEANNDVVRWTLTGRSYPNITLTPPV